MRREKRGKSEGGGETSTYDEEWEGGKGTTGKNKGGGSVNEEREEEEKAENIGRWRREGR